MLEKLKQLRYQIGLAVVSAGAFFGVLYNGVDKTVKDVGDAVTAVVETVAGPERGTPEWFDARKAEHATLVEQIKDTKYELRNTHDWNEQTTKRFNLNSYKKTCVELVADYNEVAATKQVPEIPLASCD